MSHEVESLAYAASGGLPWHGLGEPVSNDMSVEDMLLAAKLDWTVSKQPLYFPVPSEEGKTRLRIVPNEYALIRDSDLTVLDTVGPDWKPIQNADVFDFFKRFVEAGDMRMETAGSLKNGKFIWALAKFDGGFTINGSQDRMESYLLLSQPHQFGFSVTAALTAVRVVCKNTLVAALGSALDGSRKGGNTFRMTHARAWDDAARSDAERALGLAHESMKSFSHTAELLSGVSASDDKVVDYFHDVLQVEQAELEADADKIEEVENRNVKRFLEHLVSAPGAELNTAKGTWWGSYNAVTYTVDHVMSRERDTRLFNAWYGNGATMKRRALDLAVQYANAA